MKIDINQGWPEIKKLFKNSFRTSLHFSIASVDPDGKPHITPIGSLILGEACKGIYFEEYTRKLPKHCGENNEVCILAVNSGRFFWLKSLLSGEFLEPPALRLYGKLGQRREATEEEIRLWKKRIQVARFTKGYERMWKSMRFVREIYFTRAEPVTLGQVTQNSLS